MANDHSYFIHKGQNKRLRFTAKYADSGLPLDISGTTLTLTVRTKIGGIKLFEVAGTLVDAANGIGEFAFVPSHTEDADPLCYSYDAWADDLAPGDQTIPLIPPAHFDIRATTRPDPPPAP